MQFKPANTLKWALTADYPNTDDFNLYNYPNNRNDITVKGATGNVGRKTIEILEKSKLPISNLYLVASKKSAGKKLNFKKKKIKRKKN